MEFICQLHILPIYPYGKNPGTHGTGEWVGFTASLDAIKREKVAATSTNQIIWFSILLPSDCAE
jgi:hypothetical protein